MIPVGVQLYSVHREAARDLRGTLREVARLGYEGVEFAGLHGHDPAEVAGWLGDCGLRACGTHTPLAELEGDALAATIAAHRELGCPYAIVPALAPELRSTRPALLATARRLDAIAAALAPAGIRTGYHAHDDDFPPIGGQTAWDILFAAASPPVVMQLDTGNAHAGGIDPLAVLARFPGRSETIHLKEAGGAHGAAIGEGDLPWPRLLALCAGLGGTRWYVVEYEVEGVDAFDGLARCRAGLRRFGV
ncbi:MAG: TIM barrel protein [Planctomycetes bacterium]|nr:TIM barrel protein [Planctomycetota bacterium]